MGMMIHRHKAKVNGAARKAAPSNKPKAENKEVKVDEPEKRQDGVFVKDIVDLNCFSVRTLNILYAADIRTVGDLTKLHKTDVLKLRNAGKTTLSEINDFFEKYGLEWNKD